MHEIIKRYDRWFCPFCGVYENHVFEYNDDKNIWECTEWVERGRRTVDRHDVKRQIERLLLLFDLALTDTIKRNIRKGVSWREMPVKELLMKVDEEHDEIIEAVLDFAMSPDPDFDALEKLETLDLLREEIVDKVWTLIMLWDRLNLDA